MTSYKVYVFLILIIFGQTSVSAKPISMIFVRPDNAFWSSVEVMQLDAARDLGIQAKAYNSSMFMKKGQPERVGIRKAMEKAVSEKPDYIITYAVRNLTFKMLSALKGSRTKVFLINSEIPESDKVRLGKPREIFSNFIGHMYPDDEQAGYDLAKTLMTEASKQMGPSFELVATSGSRDSTPGLLRAKGLERALQEFQKTKLRRLVYIRDWSPERASKIVSDLKKKHPKVAIGWAASDAMAAAISKTMSQSGAEMNKNFFTGGFDWHQDAVEGIKSGLVTASLGGHFMEAAWATVLLYDYHHGKDFDRSMGVEIKSKMAVLHTDNIKTLGRALSLDRLKKIDFKSLSRHHNPKNSNYSFELEKISQQFLSH